MATKKKTKTINILVPMTAQAFGVQQYGGVATIDATVADQLIALGAAEEVKKPGGLR